MKKHIFKKVFAFALCIMIALSMLIPVSAASQGSLGITFKNGSQALSGVKFSLYAVAERKSSGAYALTDAFSGYNVSLDNLDSDGLTTLATTLSPYVSRDKIAAYAEAKTDANGKLTFSQLSEGLYLAKGETLSTDTTTYIPQPFIVSVPSYDTNGKAIYDIDVEAKVEVIDKTPGATTAPPTESTKPNETTAPTKPGETTAPTKPGETTAPTKPNEPTEPAKPTKPNEPTKPTKPGKTVERHIIIEWDDPGLEKKRPSEITVQLLRDGEVYDEFTLNSSNNWRHSWTDLDPSYNWEIVEKISPDGYGISIERHGDTFKIIHPRRESGKTEGTTAPTTEPGGETLPQTGVLWWPVPVFLGAGTVMVIVGILLKKKREKN